MEPVKPTELRAFFTRVIEIFERLGIPYMVVGGFAAIFYGEPRFTIDIDLVADIQFQHITSLLAAFPLPEFYLSEEAMRDALRHRYPFNVIQPSTGAKVDIVPLPRDVFTRLAFQRRRQQVYDDSGRTAWFITAEDIVLAKLMAHRETGSDKHLRDAHGVLLMQWDELNLDAIRRGAQGAGVSEHLERLLGVVQSNLPTDG